MTPNELEAYDAMMHDRDRWRERAERLESLCPSDATPCSAALAEARKEAAQNWRFFEVAAANHQQTMENANALLWSKMEWESIAYELAGFVKPGWEDSDAALARFEAAKSEL